MPAVRSDLNGGLLTCLSFIMYQEYDVICILPTACKPDMVLVSMYDEYNLSESESEATSNPTPSSWLQVFAAYKSPVQSCANFSQ